MLTLQEQIYLSEKLSSFFRQRPIWEVQPLKFNNFLHKFKTCLRCFAKPKLWCYGIDDTKVSNWLHHKQSAARARENVGMYATFFMAGVFPSLSQKIRMVISLKEPSQIHWWPNNQIFGAVSDLRFLALSRKQKELSEPLVVKEPSHQRILGF